MGQFDFFADPNAGITYDQLQQRRAIAQALATRKKGFPKNVGEGMTYLGESIGEGLQDMALRNAERQVQQRGQDMVKGAPTSIYTPPAPTAPPATTGRQSSAPPAPATPPAATGQTSDLPVAGPQMAALDDGTSVPLPRAFPIQDDTAKMGVGNAWGTQSGVKGLIAHHTGGGKTVDDTINTLQERRLGAQYAIGRDGDIHQLLPDNAVGRQIMPGRGVGEGLTNKNTIGMELVARDNRDVQPAQVSAAEALASRLGLKYGFDPATATFGHGQVNPGHKEADEGMAVVNALRGDRTQVASVDRSIPQQPGSVLQYASLGPKITGRGSWFGDAPGGWRDPSNGSTTASGISTAQPGIALPSGAGLKRDFRVTTPDGRSFVMPQTDKGPAAWTGRSIDVSGAGGAEMGYTPANFPTDATFSAEPVVPLPPERPQASTEVAQGDTAAPSPAAEAAQGDGGGDAPVAAPAPTQVAAAPAPSRSPSDTRNAVTDALLAQQSQDQSQSGQDDSQSYLQDVAGLTGRSTLQSRPTASLGRGGVASDAPQLGLIAPMGRLGDAAPPPAPAASAAPPPAATPGAPATPDQSPDVVRDAVAQRLMEHTRQQPAQAPQDASALSPVAGLVPSPDVARGVMDQPGPVGDQPFGPMAAAALPPDSNPRTITDIQPMPVGGPGDQLAQAQTQAQPQSPGRAPLPSQEAIPPTEIKQFPTTPPLGPAPRPLGPDDAMNYWAARMNDNRLSPYDRKTAEDNYTRIDNFRKEEQQRQWKIYELDYNRKAQEAVDARNWDLKSPEMRLTQDIQRLNMEKLQAENSNNSVVAEQKRVELAAKYVELQKARQGIIGGQAPAGPAGPAGSPAAGAPDPRFNTPQSPQRNGIPVLPPPPPGTSPDEWSKQTGPDAAKAVLAVDRATNEFHDSINLIRKIREHPGLDAGTGFTGQYARAVKGTNAYDFADLSDRLKARAFLTGYQTLKGGGPISNVEGEKSTASQGVIDPDQSKAAYVANLNNLELNLRRDLEMAQRKVNRPVTAWRGPGDNETFAPDIGSMKTFKDGTKRYIGGNPHDDNNWKPVQ